MSYVVFPESAFMIEEHKSFNDALLQQEYSSLIENMSVFIGKKRKDPSQIRLYESNFGGDRLSIQVDNALITYLWGFHSGTFECTPIFDVDILNKWKIVTIFSCCKYVLIENLQGNAIDSVIPTLIEKEHYSSLAALAGFPLLENIARKISKKWDNQGKITAELSKEFYNLKKDYKVGQKISSFKDKMQIMMLSMPAETQKEWHDFDNLTRQPDVKGIQHDPIPSLFERLHNRRNNWAHGQEFKGEEGVLISLIIKFIYLHSLLYQLK